MTLRKWSQRKAQPRKRRKYNGSLPFYTKRSRWKA